MSSDDGEAVAQTPPLSRKRPRTPRQSCFVDDGTGERLLHPAALRCAIKIMDAEAQLTIQSVSKSLMDNGELVRNVLFLSWNLIEELTLAVQDASRQVQVRSEEHVRKIASNVRDRLRDVRVSPKFSLPTLGSFY